MMRALAAGFAPHAWVNVHSGMEALFLPYDHRAEVCSAPSGFEMCSIQEKPQSAEECAEECAKQRLHALAGSAGAGFSRSCMLNFVASSSCGRARAVFSCADRGMAPARRCLN